MQKNMNVLYTTAKYSIATAAALMLLTAAPAFAAKRDPNNTKAQRNNIVQTIEAAITKKDASVPTTTTTTAATSTNTDTVTATSTGTSTISVAATTSVATTTSTSTPAAPIETTPTPSPVMSAILAAEQAISASAKTLFTKPTATATTTATTTGAVATTGIASLFQGSLGGGSVYASNKFDQADTYQLLALALALAAAGLFLTNPKMFSRTYNGLADITITPPQTTRSRA